MYAHFSRNLAFRIQRHVQIPVKNLTLSVFRKQSLTYFNVFMMAQAILLSFMLIFALNIFTFFDL